MSADQVLALHRPLLHEIRARQAGMRAIPEVIARHRRRGYLGIGFETLRPELDTRAPRLPLKPSRIRQSPGLISFLDE